jgi:ribosomal protein L37E
MCQLCNGTHVVHTTGSFYTQIATCPNCGPVPEQIRMVNWQAFRRRLEAERELMSKR